MHPVILALHEQSPGVGYYELQKNDRSLILEISWDQARLNDEVSAVLVIRDITERQQAEQELERHQEHLEELVEQRTIELAATNQQLRQEILERQQAEQELQASEAALRELYLITSSSNLTFNQQLQSLLELGCRRFDLEMGMLGRVDHNCLEVAAVHSPHSHIFPVRKGNTLDLSKTYCQSVLGAKEPVAFEAAHSSNWCTHPAYNASHVEAYIGTPVSVADDGYGVLSFFSLNPRQKPFTTGEKEFLRLMAQWIGGEMEQQRSQELLRESKEQLQDSQAFLDQVLNSIADPIFVKNDQHHWLFLNHAFCELVGHRRDELLGKSDHDFLPKEQAEIFWAKDDLVLTTGVEDVNEEFITDARGCLRTISTKKTCFQTTTGQRLLVGTIRDITKRKQAEEALQQSEEKFRNLVEQTNDWIWEIDRKGMFTYVSPRVRDILGCAPEDILGKSTIDFMTEDEAQRFSSLLNSFILHQKSFSNLEKTLLHANGKLVVLETSGSPIFDAQGCLQGYRGIARDITERKENERKIRAALDKEKELNDLKARFISMASHEFRTPLSIILTCSELLQYFSDQWTEAEKLEQLQMIQTSAQDMKQLLEDVLTLGRAEAGKLQLTLVALNLTEFCSYLIKQMELSTDSSCSIQFISTCFCSEAFLDAKLLQHVLMNLLSNAIKYSSPGNTIQFDLRCESNHAIFVIQDRGIGIPLEDQSHLFESFYRATNVGTISGTGLGLAIVDRCVRAMQGEIMVDSEPGVGTTFRVRLPLVPAET